MRSDDIPKWNVVFSTKLINELPIRNRKARVAKHVQSLHLSHNVHHATRQRAPSHVGCTRFLAVLYARPPVTWPASAMGDRDNANDLSVAAEDECVRESAERNATMNEIQLLAKRR
jgi:hypothetical protein